ncbi:MAG: GNAT family N-acetyltransferase [Chitinispirillaceae bacterium]|jgi:ribosomal protein S18 acetylase RimI-like enzyme|nr:GNAT family N-acetyltransferase [Chitinispirillaceae bacterium]
MRRSTGECLADLSRPDHALALVTCINAYMADPMGGGLSPMDAVCAQGMINGLRQLTTTVVFLAWHDAAPVGASVCFRGFSTFCAAPLLNIHDIVVVPAFRKTGVGTRLMAAIDRYAREIGCCRITLEVRSDNTAAQSLYFRCGFLPGSPPVAFWTKPLR